ncbi:MAG: shikimate kinase [Planctomycetaceae bacterium]|jgi:shikimate kinase|nr:shikimate kinase [Planctomycetaceae bacterium]
MMTAVILIGYRGTGKTSVAKHLADRIGGVAADSDPEIERRTGKTIAEIFAQDGETVFRDWEEAVIADLLRQDFGKPLVLATGGGAVLRETTRKRLKETGTVIWLTAKPETILQRIQADAASRTMRPNLTALPPLQEIIAVLEKRTPLYADAADTVIETDGKTVEEITALLSDAP